MILLDREDFSFLCEEQESKIPLAEMEICGERSPLIAQTLKHTQVRICGVHREIGYINVPGMVGCRNGFHDTS